MFGCLNLPRLVIIPYHLSCLRNRMSKIKHRREKSDTYVIFIFSFTFLACPIVETSLETCVVVSVRHLQTLLQIILPSN